jgi:MarR family transcriptional regulator, organic hydroperoxide resistance regulator
MSLEPKQISAWARFAAMPKLFASDDDADLLRAERDVRAAFEGHDLDLRSLSCVSNIFRAATAVRNHMDGSVLAKHDLSWSAFTVLFVLRVWGEMDAQSLASEAGITPGTLTGVMKTLEARDMLLRRSDKRDGRRVVVSSSATGAAVIDDVMPAFNRHESLVTGALSATDSDTLSMLLRRILRTVENVED